MKGMNSTESQFRGGCASIQVHPKALNYTGMSHFIKIFNYQKSEATFY